MPVRPGLVHELRCWSRSTILSTKVGFFSVTALRRASLTRSKRSWMVRGSCVIGLSLLFLDLALLLRFAAANPFGVKRAMRFTRERNFLKLDFSDSKRPE